VIEVPDAGRRLDVVGMVFLSSLRWRHFAPHSIAWDCVGAKSGVAPMSVLRRAPRRSWIAGLRHVNG
jgi:hypothetical protein